MPIYDLEMMAELSSNVQQLQVSRDYVWHIQFKCLQCDELTGWITVDPLQEEERVRSGKCHVALHCRLCSKQCTVTVVDQDHCYQNNNEFQTFAAFDCRQDIQRRGLEPVDWQPVGESFSITLENGTIINNVALDQGEYYDYDESLKEEVSVMSLQSHFRRI
eukprot:jgi/Galph1/5334/GphlegSOOS_G3925.1